jgi:hypothetical protein
LPSLGLLVLRSGSLKIGLGVARGNALRWVMAGECRGDKYQAALAAHSSDLIFLRHCGTKSRCSIMLDSVMLTSTKAGLANQRSQLTQQRSRPRSDLMWERPKDPYVSKTRQVVCQLKRGRIWPKPLELECAFIQAPCLL